MHGNFFLFNTGLYSNVNYNGLETGMHETVDLLLPRDGKKKLFEKSFMF